jgi:Endoplasmic reticulum protein ERp29, C-terminal domain
MKGVMEKGEDYVEKQRERMNKLLTGKISENKINELTKKLNILGSFRFPSTSSNDEL